MPKYKPIDYRDICDMVETITKMKGEPQRLADVISSIEKHMDIGVNPVKVCHMLRHKIVEREEDVPVYGLDGNVECYVRKITTLVIP